jgi:cell division septal protein FtsQ
VYTNLPEKRARVQEAEPLVEEEPVSHDPESPERPGVFSRVRERLANRREQKFTPNYEYDASEPEPEDEREYRDSQSWRNSRWTPVLFVIALAALCGVAYFATGFESDLKLERITVEGAHMLKDKEIIALAGIDRSQKFYSIDLKKIAERIEKHSLIKASFPRRETNPSTIVLRIEERQPIAMMRSEATGETLLIDKDGVVLRPKHLAGLKDPERLMQVPLFSGINEHDTQSYLTMARFVTQMRSIDSGALADAIGELHKTPTGAYVIYTLETQTPIFIGTPNDAPFITSLEAERLHTSGTPKPEALNHFTKQLHLLATLWRKKLHQDVRITPPFYIDARFSGQIIVRQKQSGVKLASVQAQAAQSKPLASLTNDNASAPNATRDLASVHTANARTTSSQAASSRSTSSRSTSVLNNPQARGQHP